MEPPNVGGRISSIMTSESQDNLMDAIHKIALLYVYDESILSFFMRSK